MKESKDSLLITVKGSERLLRKLKELPVPVLVNVLEPGSYLMGFLRGSKKIPLSQLDQRIGELDKNKEVIVYCASYDCSASEKAAELLSKRGFRVRAYRGGLKEWKESNLPMEPGIQIAA